MPFSTFGGAEVERDRWGRPMLTPPGGGKPTAYTRATTLAGALEDSSNLIKWKSRMTLIGAGKQPHLAVAALAAIDNKTLLNQLAEQAAEAAGAGVAATIGTAVHSFTERHDKGEPLGDVPGQYLPDVHAYIKATEKMTRLHVEELVVCDELKSAGTPDLIVTYEGENYIADKKTGSIDYPHKMAAQLGIYAHSQHIDIATGQRTPLPKVNGQRGIIIHLPAGEGVAKLYWIDIAAGWAAVQLGVKVREWRSNKYLLQPIDSFAVALENLQDVGLIDDPISAQLQAAATVPDALAIFDQNKDIWTSEHKDVLTQRIIALS